ncbi:hypothetical protein Fcan01_17424 [Folsomia candida]|uniref:Uncharacterized protein n=1 Tax=Folsomia candida TaxID=158441 RepID=A0A226DRH5_FOLCA|nr:hypothetical protein Fcan01_17424 [Folsomia candida]
MHKFSKTSDIELIPWTAANHGTFEGNSIRSPPSKVRSELAEHNVRDAPPAQLKGDLLSGYNQDRPNYQPVDVDFYILPITEKGNPICRPYRNMTVVFVVDGKYPFFIQEDRKPISQSDLAETSPFYKTLLGEDSPHTSLKNLYPIIRNRKIAVGLTSFTDWAEHNNASQFYCYEFITSTDGLLYYPPRNVLPQIDADKWDSTLNAVYFTAVDSKFNWEAEVNVIVFISNNKWKWVGDDNPMQGQEYKFPSPDGEGTKTPCEQGPVSKSVLYSALEKRRILLIGLLTPNIYQEYKMFFKDAPNPDNFQMFEINGTAGATDEKIAAGIKDQIMPLIQARACTCQIRYEFALMIDSTQTFIEKFARDKRYPNDKKSYFPQAMPKITFIVDKILREDPTAKLHLTTFGDYPTVENNNANASYCYRYELTTSNKRTFLTAVKKVDSTYGGRDKYESSLTALLYTATEPKIKWSPKDTKHVIKIIAIATDTFWKSYNIYQNPVDAGPEYKYPVGPVGEFGNCSHRLPISDDVFDKLGREQFYLIPMIYGDNSTRLWNDTLSSLMRDKYFIEKEPVWNSDFYDVGNAINGWANDRSTFIIWGDPIQLNEKYRVPIHDPIHLSGKYRDPVHDPIHLRGKYRVPIHDPIHDWIGSARLADRIAIYDPVRIAIYDPVRFAIHKVTCVCQTEAEALSILSWAEACEVWG